MTYIRRLKISSYIR